MDEMTNYDKQLDCRIRECEIAIEERKTAIERNIAQLDELREVSDYRKNAIQNENEKHERDKEWYGYYVENHYDMLRHRKKHEELLLRQVEAFERIAEALAKGLK